VWLLLLALNLIGSALSRMLWKKHHTGFLLTHLGIIILLIGSFIGHTRCMDGTMTVIKGAPPTNLLIVDERVLQISEDEKTAQVVPLEFINRKPSPEAVVASGRGLEYPGDRLLLFARGKDGGASCGKGRRASSPRHAFHGDDGPEARPMAICR